MTSVAWHGLLSVLVVRNNKEISNGHAGHKALAHNHKSYGY